MFDIPKRRNARRQASLLASFLVHCMIVFAWLDRAPVFVRPYSVTWGLHGKAEKITYFPRATAPPPVSKEPLMQVKAERKPPLEEVPENTRESARTGASNGSLSQGPDSGSEARPALPVVFPDPAIFFWQLPKGLQGDVIVEVTIDAQGKVTETRILQSLQQEIDQKVIATLRNWRFTPATVDGVAISSRQDVHFHFPS
jgi:periplasmic protein TonB